MKLINATPSPWGRKVAIALHEKAIPFEVQWDVPWVETTCVADYSPLQQLPILLTDANEAIYDSTYILEWLELRHPAPALRPAGIDALALDRLVQILGERLMEISALIAFEAMRPDPSEPWLARQLRKIDTGLAEAAKVVGSRTPPAETPATLGDITLGVTLTMFEFMIEHNLIKDYPQFAWRAKHRGLIDYVVALEARPSFAETRPVMFTAALEAVVA